MKGNRLLLAGRLCFLADTPIRLGFREATLLVMMLNPDVRPHPGCVFVTRSSIQCFWFALMDCCEATIYCTPRPCYNSLCSYCRHFFYFVFLFSLFVVFLAANFLGKAILYEDAFVKLKPRLSYSSCDLTELHYILKKVRLIVFKLFTWTKHTQLFAFF